MLCFWAGWKERLPGGETPSVTAAEWGPEDKNRQEYCCFQVSRVSSLTLIKKILVPASGGLWLYRSCFSHFSGDFLCARVCFIVWFLGFFLGQATLRGERQPAGECGEREQWEEASEPHQRRTALAPPDGRAESSDVPQFLPHPSTFLPPRFPCSPSLVPPMKELECHSFFFLFFFKHQKIVS